MKTMTTAEIRRAFLNYFSENGHKIVHSASLVPGNDPTLLFTNAGMVPFKELFIGTETRDYRRATSAQRCVRAGGKHNDLENVGYTARHHTFFEMLGNFSFGDYFKAEAIPFAWRFLTEVLQLPAEKLLVTVYHEDDEAYRIWQEKIGLPADRIIRIGDKAGKAKYESDNFWAMGDTGPCGPCTEIFYDHGAEIFGGRPGSADEDGDRFIEIWNIVFMQFERDAEGTMKPLPKPSIDTGMGLERIAAVMQGVHSNYDIDLFIHLIDAAAKAVGCKNEGQASLKVIADHIRATVFLTVDGVLPSNEGRGYVLRRIMRRAIRHGYKLGQQGLFFHKLVAALVAEMGEAYPEIIAEQARITETIRKEELRFAQTLTAGMQILEQDLATLKGTIISGETVFKLYDTYGFPVDLTNDIARERGLTLDEAGYEALMQAQRERAKASGTFRADKTYTVSGKTAFLAYQQEQTESTIEAIFVQEQAADTLDCGDEAVLVLNQSPFYGESGGQIGDSGVIYHQNGAFLVSDTQKQGDVLLHFGRLQRGVLSVGDTVCAEIDRARRAAIRRHHSATHLLHQALRMTLGTHVQQKGSLVDADKLRFDFSHDAALTAAEISAVEQLINEQILRNQPVNISEMPYDQACAQGAMALFGEKYGDIVRVVKMGADDFSVELCGGTHVKQTGDLGLVKIIAQSAVAAGIRRVECVAGLAVLRYCQQQETQLQRIAAVLKSDLEHSVEKIERLQQDTKTLEKTVQQLKRTVALGGAQETAESVVDIHGWKTMAVRRDDLDNAILRDTADQLRDKYQLDVVVIGSSDGEMARLVVSVAKSAAALKAGAIVQTLAAFIDGKGGGRPDFAQAGGKNIQGLDAALAALPQALPQK